MEPDREEILDLIVRWEEAKAQGQDLAPEELCRDCPDLLSGFRRQVEKLGQVAWLNGPIEAASRRQGRSRTSRPTPTCPGLLADRYRLDALIGEGGFGRVYRAFDTWLERAGGREGAPGGPPRHRWRGGPVPDRGPQGGPAAAPEHRPGP